MRGKRYNRNNNNYKLKKIIVSTICLICIVTMIVSGVKIIRWFRENKSSKEIIEKNISNTISIDENVENIDKYNVNFEALKQTNPDTVGWLKVNGTNIEYPVLKTIDNDFYMTHSFDKSNNGVGWVFADYKNKIDGKDKNIVIYAHNRRDGSMFGTLKNILTKEWQNNEENYIIPFITEDEKAEYQVFSIYRVEREDYYITTNFESSTEFQNFINKIKSRSIKDFEINVNDEDQILTLSTCADNNKYRVVLHAKKIQN